MTKKETAMALLKMASAGEVREACAKDVHPEFRHHNAYYQGDRQTLLERMEENAKQVPQKGHETLRGPEDGNLVAVHGRVADWLAP